MRFARIIAVGVTLAVTAPIVTTQTGCSVFQVEDTPRGRYFEAQELFIVAVATANQAMRNGSISQGDWDTVWLPAINEGNALLDLMESAYLSGDTESFNLARASLNAITRLLNGGA